MTCEKCGGAAIRWGKDRQGQQRWKCKACGVTRTEAPPSPIAPMRLRMDQAVLVLSLLVEGISIRSAERISGHHRDTICRLLVLAGRKCERLLDSLVKGVKVEDVEADEIWGFIGSGRRRRAGSSRRISATPTPSSVSSAPRSWRWRTTSVAAPGRMRTCSCRS